VPTVQAVPIDEGFIDYPTFFEALREGGFDGLVAYEMCSPLRGGGSMENLDSYARRFLDFMKAEMPVGAGAGRRSHDARLADITLS